MDYCARHGIETISHADQEVKDGKIFDINYLVCGERIIRVYELPK